MLLASDARYQIVQQNLFTDQQVVLPNTLYGVQCIVLMIK